MAVSIHALVKRATSYFPPNFQLAVVSIHALVKRATLLRERFYKPRRCFNPRPREEGDPTKSTTFPSTKPVSIHALVKRATFHHQTISQ